jgi:hypothetical protein
MRHAILGFGLFLGAACGGSVTTIGGAGSDSGVTRDDGATTGSDSSTGSDAMSRDSSSTCLATAVPINHRATDIKCPLERGQGVSTTGDGGGLPGTCDEDSDCTMGQNGRCLPRGFGADVDQCSYDDCSDDGACTGNVPCVCRSSGTSTDPNVCGAGSNCRVDSDCGSCGFCSPSESKQAICGRAETTYFCHTKNDLCTNDQDCHEGGCNYVPSKGYWECGTECAPPPP